MKTSSLSAQLYSGSDIVAWGIKLSPVCAPLHFIQLTLGIVFGSFQTAVCPQLPVPGVDLVLCNDLAGGKIFPSPKVVTNPIVENAMKMSLPSLFPVCAVTHTQARKFEDMVDLGDSLLVSPDPADFSSECGGTPLCKENASVTVELHLMKSI